MAGTSNIEMKSAERDKDVCLYRSLLNISQLDLGEGIFIK